MADVDRLSDLDIAEDAPEHAALAEPEAEISKPADEKSVKRKGLLGGLLGRADKGDAARDADGDPEVDDVDQELLLETKSEAVEPLDLPDVAAIQDEERPRTGLLGFLNRKAEERAEENERPSVDIVEEAPNDPAELVKLAALGEPAADPKATTRRGFFGKTRRPPAPKQGASEYQQVGPNTILPYGDVARLCGVPTDKLGKRVGRYPETGRGYMIYDSDPDNTDPRNFYVTGFDDGCARQFTAALVMFGAASMHELLRYGLPAEVHPYSTTDKAYEKIKRRICGVGRNKPCGAKIAEVEKTTVFVSVYERFGSNPRWKTMLLHDGALVATDIKESDES